jgi:hypothetical protein
LLAAIGAEVFSALMISNVRAFQRTIASGGWRVGVWASALSGCSTEIRGVCYNLELIMFVATIELTARIAKIKPSFRGLRGFAFMAFIKNNIQKLLATRIVIPTCHSASFLKHFLRNFVDIILRLKHR